jgi:hypothetical protein
LVQELARVVRLMLPMSQLEASALEQALRQPPLWAALRLAQRKRFARLPRAPRFVARSEFWRQAVEWAPAPRLPRRGGLQPPGLAHLHALGSKLKSEPSAVLTK